jgi:NTE family protein
MLVERFEAYQTARKLGQAPPSFARYGVLFGLASSFSAPDDWPDEYPEDARGAVDLALTKTTFSRLDAGLCRRLVYRGWWLTGAALLRFHPKLLTGGLPSWRLF